jgi:hypothetical protein
MLASLGNGCFGSPGLEIEIQAAREFRPLITFEKAD